MRAAFEAILLGPALGVDQLVEAAGGADVEEDVQHRELLRPGAPNGAPRQADQLAGDLGPYVCLTPLGQRLAIELGGTLSRPGPLGADTAGKASDAAAGDEDIPEHAEAETRNRPAVTTLHAAHVEQVTSLAKLGKDLDAQFTREALHPGVVGADPLATEIDLHAIAERGVEQAPADPLPRLEHDHLVAGIKERTRGAQS